MKFYVFFQLYAFFRSVFKIVVYANCVARTHFDSKLMSIHELFSGSKYTVPKYQREYSWTKDEVEEFVRDVLSLVKPETDRSKPYFFGAMVLVDESDVDKSIFKIVDGQQRIITSAIFIAVLRDMLHREGNYEAAGEFARYIQEKDLESGDIFDRIIPNNRNQEFFRDCIMKIDNPDEKSKNIDVNTANTNILNAYKIIYKELTERITETRDLVVLCGRFVKNFRTIVVIVESNADAYRIFETLNNRGLELSEGDLVKNHLLEKCADNEQLQDKVFAAWTDITENLDKIKMDDFLRHFWMANYDKIKKDEIYTEISDKLSKGTDVKDLVERMDRYSKIYARIVNPNEEDWTNKQIRTNLETLKILNSKVCYVALLVGVDKFEDADKQQLIQLTEMCINFFFRYKTIMGEHATDLETLMKNVATDLRKGKSMDVIKKERFLDPTIYPDDERFENSFKNASLIDKIAAYVLQKLNGQHIENVHVEHIMPRNIQGTNWETYLKEQDADLTSYVEQWYAKLGNMTLTGKLSTEDKKRSYAEKWAKFYKDSSVEMTKELPIIANWNHKEIEHRQNKFAKKALTIWKIE